MPDDDAGSEDAGDARMPPDEDAGRDDAAVGPCEDGSARGDCGCPGEPGGEAAGTACDDGACPLSSQCDGQGSCGTTADCAKPDPGCGNVMLQLAGHYYYVCPSLQTWDQARAACRTNPHFDLIRVDDDAEQAFLETSVTSLTNAVWINATDTAMADSWAWMDDGTVFWMGTSTGAAVGGQYNDWFTDEPSASGDCARHTVDDDAWRASDCGEMHFFVCEAAPP